MFPVIIIPGDEGKKKNIKHLLRRIPAKQKAPASQQRSSSSSSSLT
jgi:hypothetical protein